MSTRHDPLDAKLTRLCSLAEMTIVLLSTIDRVRHAFVAHRFDPDARIDELKRLSVTGRAVHSDRLDGVRAALVADEQAAAAAQAAFATLPIYRRKLQALDVLLDDPTASDDLAVLRRHMRLTRPRLTGTFDLFRRLYDHLEPADHPVHRHPLTADMRADVGAHVHQLSTALRQREDANRARRIAVKRANAAREDLRAVLRRIRVMGEVVCIHPTIPASLFEHLQTRRRPRTPPEVPHDAATPPQDCATSTHNGATSTHDSATPTHDHATAPHSPATAPHDAATPIPGSQTTCAAPSHANAAPSKGVANDV